MTVIWDSPAGQQAVQERYREYLGHWPVPSQQLQVPTRHGETFAVACGPPGAPPVVLLHGAGTNTAMWAKDAAAWAAARRVYAVDVIGEPGLSAPSRPPLASDAYAGWLDDVLDGLGASRAALVGVSLGGWLALDYAIRRPARVERLAVLAPGGIGRQKYGAVAASLVLMPLGDRSRSLALRLALGPVPAPGTPADRAFSGYVLLIQQHYRPRRDRLPVFTDDQLRTLTMPLLAIAGARDGLLDSRQTTRRLRRLLPGADVTLLRDSGHLLLGQTQRIGQFLTAGDPGSDN
jgi:pimeloyl-ACP methyl ester carboxylesterase